VNQTKTPSGIRIRDDEVHVWAGDQNQPAEIVSAFHRTLSEDERSRAARFKFEKDRVHYVVARGMLRRLLGYYLGTPPDRLRFRYSEFDKPALAEEFQASRLRFNLSHSGGRALLGFTLGREIGIDIEQIRPDFATEDIAERFFSGCEVEQLRSLPKELQAEAFFNCWTRKEAFIKAIGEGLSCPLNQFDVTLTPGEPARLLATRVAGQPASAWSLRSLNVGPAYRAAIVVQGADWSLSLHHVTEIGGGTCDTWLLSDGSAVTKSVD
jgi:4'-phosphopantetheinyl transferase